MTYDRSAELGPAGDQGNRSTCLAFAATAAHGLTRLSSRGGSLQALSEEALYYLAKDADGNTVPGTTPASVGKVLLETGQPQASRWPYNPSLSDSDPLPLPPPGALAREGMYRAFLEEIGSELDELSASSQSGVGVVLGIDMWPAFFAPRGDTVPVPALGELLGDAHAVALVGVDQVERRLLVRNSWGAAWGEAGHAWIAEIAWRRSRLGAWLIRDSVDPREAGR